MNFLISPLKLIGRLTSLKIALAFGWVSLSMCILPLGASEFAIPEELSSIPSSKFDLYKEMIEHLHTATVLPDKVSFVFKGRHYVYDGVIQSLMHVTQKSKRQVSLINNEEFDDLKKRIKVLYDRFTAFAPQYENLRLMVLKQHVMEYCRQYHRGDIGILTSAYMQAAALGKTQEEGVECFAQASRHLHIDIERRFNRVDSRDFNRVDSRDVVEDDPVFFALIKAIQSQGEIPTLFKSFTPPPALRFSGLYYEDIWRAELILYKVNLLQCLLNPEKFTLFMATYEKAFDVEQQMFLARFPILDQPSFGSKRKREEETGGPASKKVKPIPEAAIELTVDNEEVRTLDDGSTSDCDSINADQTVGLGPLFALAATAVQAAGASRG